MHTWQIQQSKCHSPGSQGQIYFLHTHLLQAWATEDLCNKTKYIYDIVGISVQFIEIQNTCTIIKIIPNDNEAHQLDILNNTQVNN